MRLGFPEVHPIAIADYAAKVPTVSNFAKQKKSLTLSEIFFKH